MPAPVVKRSLAHAMLVALVFALAAGSAATSAREPPNRLDEIDVSTLPPEARAVLARIRAGGPFHYERDGIAFGNREHALPPRRRGYYHEYTVTTPGERTRGARRIVCGGPRQAPEVCYYTSDHYATFRRIRE
ncbi:MAG TPA: ribonuclease domain-containing protein [Casimicrobiaceae bacterium]|jgi:ribonuclease T1|nr:ribonuclease domain-containing protein [Casimicrobiaceae bacterium]